MTTRWVFYLLTVWLIAGTVIAQEDEDPSPQIKQITERVKELNDNVSQLNDDEEVGVWRSLLQRSVKAIREETEQLRDFYSELSDEVRKSLGGFTTEMASWTNEMWTSFKDKMFRWIDDRGDEISESDNRITGNEKDDYIEGVNAFSVIIDQLVGENIDLLLKKLNGWPGVLLDPLGSILLNPRRKLLEGLGTPVSALCRIVNDSTGKLAPAKANATTSLTTIRTTVIRARTNCKDIINCLLLAPTFTKIIYSTRCL